MNANFQQPYRGAAYCRERARAALRNNWLIAIIAGLIVTLLGGGSGFSGSSGVRSSFDVKYESPEAFLDSCREAIRLIGSGEWIGKIGDHPSLVLGVVLLAFGGLIAVLLTVFVSSAINVGYQKFNLALIDGDAGNIRLGTVFWAFKACYGQSILVKLLYTLIFALCGLPLIGAGIGAVAWLYAVGSFGWADLGLASLLLTAGAVVSAVLEVVVTFRYYFADMILADHPSVGAVGAFRSSANLMRGHKWQLFCLLMSFIGWMILSAIICGIGFLFLVPYMNAATTVFYHEISGRQAAMDFEMPSIDPDDYKE